MNKYEDFASRMSELLFDMRLEDIGMSDLTTDDGTEISESYVDKILNDDKHCTAIKERIRLSVLEDVKLSPNKYSFDNGKYHYTAPNTYYHAYLVDTYIEEQYVKDNPIMETRFVCDHCGSDNVLTKVWTRPNNNMEFPDEIYTEDMNDNFCEDCDENRTLSKVKMNVRRTVIGFQVDLNYNNEMHPEMSASFCVYSLPQVNKMIEHDTNRWNLLTIYDDMIDEPTMMFNGDCREPDETVMEVLLKK